MPYNRQGGSIREAVTRALWRAQVAELADALGSGPSGS